MSGPQQEHSDSDLLELLSRALAAPHGLSRSVEDAGRAAFTWRTLETELASLLQHPPEQEVTVRASEAGRHYTFDSGTTVVDVAVEARNGTVVVRGWIDPPVPSTIRLIGTDGRELAVGAADDLGRFRIPVDAVGPVRLEVDRDPLLHTEWFRLA